MTAEKRMKSGPKVAVMTVDRAVRLDFTWETRGFPVYLTRPEAAWLRARLSTAVRELHWEEDAREGFPSS